MQKMRSGADGEILNPASSVALESSRDRNKRVRKIAAWFAVGALASGAPVQAFRLAGEYTETQKNVTASYRAKQACVDELVMPVNECLSGAPQHQLDSAKTERYLRLVEGSALMALPAGIGGGVGAAIGAVGITASRLGRRRFAARAVRPLAGKPKLIGRDRASLVGAGLQNALDCMWGVDRRDLNAAGSAQRLSGFQLRAKVVAAATAGLLAGGGTVAALGYIEYSSRDYIAKAEIAPCPPAVYQSDNCTAALLKAREMANIEQERIVGALPFVAIFGGLSAAAVGGVAYNHYGRGRHLSGVYESVGDDAATERRLRSQTIGRRSIDVGVTLIEDAFITKRQP